MININTVDQLTIYQTDKGRYSVRPINWEGIWDKQGRIREIGLNHIAIFDEKEDAEFFVRTKNLKEQGKLFGLPCKPGDTVYVLYKEQVQEMIVLKATINRFGYWFFEWKSKHGKKNIPFITRIFFI